MSYYETTTSLELAERITTDVYIKRGKEWPTINFRQGDLNQKMDILCSAKQGDVIYYFFERSNSTIEETWRKLHNEIWERIYYATYNNDESQNITWDLSKEERSGAL